MQSTHIMAPLVMGHAHVQALHMSRATRSVAITNTPRRCHHIPPELTSRCLMSTESSSPQHISPLFSCTQCCTSSAPRAQCTANQRGHHFMHLYTPTEFICLVVSRARVRCPSLPKGAHERHFILRYPALHEPSATRTVHC